MFKKDYYKILGISKYSSKEDIKKAFRKLAIETHPDKNPNDPLAINRFKEINEAYSILIDPKKRAQYESLFLENSILSISGIFWSNLNGHKIFKFKSDNFIDILNKCTMLLTETSKKIGNYFFYEQPDITYQLAISKEQAYKGATIKMNVHHLEDKKQVKIKIPPGVISGGKLKLKNMGNIIPNHPQKRGDMYLDIYVI